MSTATVIAQEIEKLQPQLQECPGLWGMFRQCFLNTIETTVQQSEGDTFVIVHEA